MGLPLHISATQRPSSIAEPIWRGGDICDLLELRIQLFAIHLRAAATARFLGSGDRVRITTWSFFSELGSISCRG